MKRLAVCLLFLVAAPAMAQESVTFSVGGGLGVAIPTGDLSDGNADVGFGFDLNAIASFTPVLGAYARFGYYTFGVDTGDPSVEGNYNDSGFGLGAHITIPTADDSSLEPWIEGGLIYNTLEVEASSGGISGSVESDPGLGFEVGAGLDFAVGDGGLTIQPQVFYRSYSPEDGLTVSYGVVGVGVRYTFTQ